MKHEEEAIYVHRDKPDTGKNSPCDDGQDQGRVRLPLCEMSKANRDKLKGVLKGMKLIK